MAKGKMTQKEKQDRARNIYAILLEAYPEVECTLEYRSPFQLLVMTILAAQSTDARVNLVTKDLFKKYGTPADFLKLSQEELEKAIHSCGFYRNKAKNILATCKDLVERHGGEVPGTMEELVVLAGVGRKTANVVLGECFGQPSVVVDTHCTRLTNRLGFTRQQDPVKIEQELRKLWPKETWTLFSHLMVFHGRAVCTARAPSCPACPVRGLCSFPETREGKKVAK